MQKNRSFFSLMLLAPTILGQLAIASPKTPPNLAERVRSISPFDPKSCKIYFDDLAKKRTTFEEEFNKIYRKKENAYLGIRTGLGLFFLGGLGSVLVPGGPLLYAIYAGSALALGEGTLSFVKAKKIQQQELCLDYAFTHETPAITDKKEKNLKTPYTDHHSPPGVEASPPTEASTPHFQ